LSERSKVRIRIAVKWLGSSRIANPEIKLFIPKLLLKLLFQIRDDTDDGDTRILEGLTRGNGAVCLNFEEEIGFEWMWDFVTREDDRFVFEELGSEHVC
jgi:hypothetical protein